MPVFQRMKTIIDSNGNKKKIPIKTKDGRSWYFRTYYTDLYGNKKQKDSQLYHSKAECKDAEAEFLLKVKVNDETDINISFSAVYNEWLELKKRKIKSSTFYCDKKCMDKNIYSFFKDYKLHSIKFNLINEYYAFLEKRDICVKYQNKMISFLREILSYARDNYNFSSKIISRIQKKKDEKSSLKRREAEWNFWTYDEFQTFIKNVEDPKFNLYFSFLYFTGMRFGEMAALTWEDFDFARKTVKIYKTLTNKLGTGSYDVFDPKTKNSIRTVQLDDTLFKRMIEYYNEEKKLYGFSNSMFIFGNIKPISSSTVRRYLNDQIKEIGIKRITIHGFRHSHVSLLYYLGCDSQEVASRVGDTISTIESTYYHMFPEKKTHTIEAINSLKISDE